MLIQINTSIDIFIMNLIYFYMHIFDWAKYLSVPFFTYINILDIYSLSQVKTDMKMHITSEKSCCKSTNKKREHLQKNEYWKLN